MAILLLILVVIKALICIGLKKKLENKDKFFGFEPQVKLFQYLKQIKGLQDYNNVILENKGLSIEVGTTSFYIPKTKSGTSPGASIEASENENFEKVEIEITTLDKYFFERQIFPTIIKLDVEGHERKVLEGGLKLLKSCHPAIIMECENRHLKNETVFDVFNILMKIGYKGYFYKDNKLLNISEFKIETHQKIGEGRFWENNNYINNFIFK